LPTSARDPNLWQGAFELVRDFKPMVGDAYNRRADVYGEVLTFGREPVYVRAAELPPQLADDRYLHIETVDSAPSVVVVIDLKSERVQEPTAAVASAARSRKRG
jgi:hypothetical protein